MLISKDPKLHPTAPTSQALTEPFNANKHTARLLRCKCCSQDDSDSHIIIA